MAIPERTDPVAKEGVIGTLYGIGVGPGDPELLTLKGLRLLRSVSTVFVPLPRSGAASYAREIVSEHLDASRQNLVELVFAMRDAPGGRAERWTRNAETILQTLTDGESAAFATEGDPMLYSTFVHIASEIARQRPDAPIVAVPGVSSISAAACAAGVPIADGDERVAVLPAVYEADGLRQALQEFDTVVLMKVGGALDRVLDTLHDLDLTTRSVCVTRCGRPDQSIATDVESLRGRPLDYFSIMIVRSRR